jgi:hypothetical protein
MGQAAVAESEIISRGLSCFEGDEDELDFSSERTGFPLAHVRKSKVGVEGWAERSGNRPAYEVADIFRLYGKEYRQRHALSREQGRAMYDIERCRTEEFGTHWDVCDMCGHREKAYCSCHNRHCPKCHGVARKIWVKERIKDLLSVPYYHTVFTLADEELHPLYLYSAEILYDLLFECAAQTLMIFGKDPHWLGAEMGFFGVLHTWGQTLWLHPHIHFVVPGGGVGEGGEWVWAKHKDTFLFPVKALSKRFRKLFTEGLKRAYEEGRLKVPPDWIHSRSNKAFDRWLRKLGGKEFVVFTKAPLGGPEGVVRYVGRYTHRVAISNHRILSIEDGQILFTYKDYKSRDEQGEYEWKEMSLPAEEFIRRFLSHILPKGFHKIRHYGFLGNGRKAQLDALKWHLLFEEGLRAGPLPGEPHSPEEEDSLRPTCPVCGVGKMLPVLIENRFGTTLIRNESYLRMKESWDTS